MARFWEVGECLPAPPIEDIALNMPMVPKQMTPIRMIWRMAIETMAGKKEELAWSGVVGEKGADKKGERTDAGRSGEGRKRVGSREKEDCG